MTTRFELVDEGFADPCLTTWPRHHIGSDEYHSIGAADEARTRYLHLAKVDAALDLLMVIKYLERIGDHAVNVAEWVQFVRTGRYKDESMF